MHVFSVRGNQILVHYVNPAMKRCTYIVRKLITYMHVIDLPLSKTHKRKLIFG